MKDNNEIRLVIGCNYHTKWQSHSDMRFILAGLSEDGKRARLQTRKTSNDFWTNTEDLIFINTKYNKRKAREIVNEKQIV